MSGHVFHPGHSELHGVTVVVETPNGVLYIGRFHEETAAGVLLHDAAEFRPSPSGPSREEFLQKTLRFGVRPERAHVLVAGTDVRRISRLVEWGEGNLPA
jgi:hypothetical protein